MNKANFGKLTALLSFTLVSSACTWTEIASVDSNGNQGNRTSYYPDISEDGKFVAYQSLADNLVPNDTNNTFDVFVRDVVNGDTTREGLDSNGNQINFGFGATGARISADGNIVGFTSADWDVVPGDTNGAYDAFVRDRIADTTTRVSVDSAGNGGNNQSLLYDMSDDGRYIVFSSDADNLVVGDTNLANDVFVHDRTTGVTTRVSVDSTGNQSNAGLANPSGCAISGDGRYVAFSSLADNLVPGDTNNAADVFLHDRITGTTTRVSVPHIGGQSNGDSTDPVLSTNGRAIAFLSEASNLVAGDSNDVRDVFIRRLGIISSTTSRVSISSAGVQANVDSDWPSMSGDGRYISFVSAADNLVPSDTNVERDVFVRDTVKSMTRRISKGINGMEADGGSRRSALSKNGRYIAYSSDATNIVTEDLNGTTDTFVRAVQEVDVTSVVPDTLPIGATTSVTLTGTDFLSGTTVVIGDSQISNLVIVDENTITMDVTVPTGTAAGARDVFTALGGTGAGPFTGSSDLCLACVSFF